MSPVAVARLRKGFNGACTFVRRPVRARLPSLKRFAEPLRGFQKWKAPPGWRRNGANGVSPMDSISHPRAQYPEHDEPKDFYDARKAWQSQVLKDRRLPPRARLFGCILTLSYFNMEHFLETGEL